MLVAMTRRGVVVLVVSVLAMVAACGGDEGEGAQDPGCALWSDLLVEQGDRDVSDTEAAGVVAQVAEETDDDEVRAFATALAARLRDGSDISASFEGLSDACGL